MSTTEKGRRAEPAFATDSGLPVNAVYGPDAPPVGPERELGEPGSFPYCLLYTSDAADEL